MPLLTRGLVTTVQLGMATMEMEGTATAIAPMTAAPAMVTTMVAMEAMMTLIESTAVPAMVTAMVAMEAIMTLMESMDVTTIPTLMATTAIRTLPLLQPSMISLAAAAVEVEVVTLIEITRIPPHCTHHHARATPEGHHYRLLIILNDTILQGGHKGYHRNPGMTDRCTKDIVMHRILVVTCMYSEARTPCFLET